MLFEARLHSPHPAPYEQHRYLVGLLAELTHTPPDVTAVRDYIWREADGIIYLRRTAPTNTLAWQPLKIPAADSLINFEVLARCRSNSGDLRPNHWKKPHPVSRRGARPPMTDPNDNLSWWYATAEKIGLEVEDAGVELDEKVIGKENRSRDGTATRPAFSLLVANFYGVAKVCDPVRFEHALATGVGDGKAFGLGFIFYWQRGQDNA